MIGQNSVLVALLLMFPATLDAGCCDLQSPSQTFLKAGAVGEYRVESAESQRGCEGRIRTIYRLVLTSALKGKAPAVVEWNVSGGLVGDEFESSSLNPGWEPGEDQILHLHQHEDGRWEPIPFRSKRNTGSPAERKALRNFIKRGAVGDAPTRTPEPDTITSSAATAVPESRITSTGYTETNGVPNRFVTSDGGGSIACIVDIDPTKLPSGVTAAGALQIVRNALNAWSAASSLKFAIESTTTFGAGADTIKSPGGKLRIQLHDTYNRIPSSSVLGIGGGGWLVDPGAGATVAGRTFNRRTDAFVVLNHRAGTMANAISFAQVLTHEIGHALGLVHSSNDANEPEPILKNATMYYTLHGDGRGAAIALYDQDRIAYGYPFNTPPVTLDRTLRAVTGSPQPTGFGVDRVRLNLFDLQTPAQSLTVNLVAPVSGFSLSGSTLTYTPSGVISDLLLSDEEIEDGSFYDKASFRVSDGVNLSPTAELTIIGFHRDNTPSDGLPDSWMNTYFGSTAVGAPGSARHPESDPDGDGLTNREERYFGTNPLNTASGLPKTTFAHASARLSFTPLRYAPYEIESSADLSTWTKRGQLSTFAAPVMSSVDLPEPAGTEKMFYRIKVAP